MPKTVQQIIGTFTSVGQRVRLLIPIGSESVALRVIESEVSPSVVITVITELVPSLTMQELYSRYFQLVLSGTALPAAFKKYVATMPFGPNKDTVHIVEV